MDVDPIEFFDDDCMDAFNQTTLDNVSYFTNNSETGVSSDLDTECLWKPSSVLEPVIDPLELQEIDEVADKVEIQRLQPLAKSSVQKG